MSLVTQLEKDFLQALKAKEELKVAVLRMVKTALKNKQVELKRPLTEEEVLKVLSKEAKQREDAATQFRQGGREDLALKEEQELEILKSYLPQKMSVQEMEEAIENALKELKPAGLKDMGKVMSYLMQKYPGQVDGKQLSQLVREKLSS
ncbi:MAG TPA: glutamyl-tRNA amidotransferase [Desulfonauticus sp.]|nr:MAG: GatB/YqeY domain-containing protein [Desulfonauticus sp. 38_4375]HCO11994.1 glutamyl-tRNA amidotransferase [Desulfonauticus sp.]